MGNADINSNNITLGIASIIKIGRANNDTYNKNFEAKTGTNTNNIINSQDIIIYSSTAILGITAINTIIFGAPTLFIAIIILRITAIFSTAVVGAAVANIAIVTITTTVLGTTTVSITVFLIATAILGTTAIFDITDSVGKNIAAGFEARQSKVCRFNILINIANYKQQLLNKNLGNHTPNCNFFIAF